MAVAVFTVGRVPRAAAMRRGEEHRVVAEAAGAAAFMQDAATPHAFGDQRLRVVNVTHERQHADETPGALRAVNTFQLNEQLVDIGFAVAVDTGVAR